MEQVINILKSAVIVSGEIVLILLLALVVIVVGTLFGRWIYDIIHDV
jgi:hypothetical protein